jgi:hypothetical protein
MKRIITAGISFIIMVLAFNSCEVFGTCKICREVTYEVGGGVISEGPESEYCDAELIAIEAKDDLIIGDKRYSWECR